MGDNPSILSVRQLPWREKSSLPGSAAKEDWQPGQIRSPDTSPESPLSDTTPPDESVLPLFLHRKSPVPSPDQITVKQLATELSGGNIDRIQPLIDHGYLRIMVPGDSLATTIVARPMPAALTWLKTLFAPLRMRPFLPVDDVAKVLKIASSTIRSFIVHYNIPIYDDPAFGELMTITGMRAVQMGIYAERHKPRFDRQAMMQFVLKQYGIPSNRVTHSYSMVLDAEIRRVCAMKEPGRTVRAVALWTAWRDAKTIGECLKTYRTTLRERSVRGKTVDIGMDVLEKGINGEIKKWTVPWREDNNGKGRRKKTPAAVLKARRKARRVKPKPPVELELEPNAPWWSGAAVEFHSRKKEKKKKKKRVGAPSRS